MIGNWFAIAALLGWPLMAAVLYKTQSVGLATVWTILGAFLLLPEAVSIKFAMIPAFDKDSIPNLCALVGCILVAPHEKRLKTGSRLTGLLIIVYIGGPVVTSALNHDAIAVGDRILPGVGSYDGISAVLSQTIFIIPFFIGRRFLRSAVAIESIFFALVVAGLFYTIPMLFEIRMSPQLSNWIYGYFPSSYSTEVRYGGFRPVVFMHNGLVVAFFIMTSLLASIALWRTKRRIGPFPPLGIPPYLGVVIVLCKSAGALVYGVIAGLLVARAAPRLQMKIAVVLVGVGLLYPVLRTTGVFPTTFLVTLAEQINDERAQSLNFRFNQENELLAHASQRFLFGWGRYGRGRLYDEDTGTDISTTDGLWIITLSTFGLVGFLAQFGLLTLPVFHAAATLSLSPSTNDRIFLATLTLILALTVVEQLPNASITPWSWLIAGALLGRSELLSATALRQGTRPAKLGASSPQPLIGE